MTTAFNDSLLSHSPLSVPSMPEIEWRVNPRAKRLRLTLKADRIWVTIPPRTSQVTTDRFLRETESWLREQWHKLQQRKQQHDLNLTHKHLAMDTHIHLPAYKMTWAIELSAKEKRLKEDSQILSVPELNKNEYLRKWVKHKAQVYLPIRLAELAEQHHFEYTGCTVRHAKTRWGSCSRFGQINLNASLILLVPELLDYVLLHELCHTREFNHSSRFWAEMSAVDPDFKSHRQALKQVVLPAFWHI
jgi:predicted metal-dependent hydrolase